MNPICLCVFALTAGNLVCQAGSFSTSGTSFTCPGLVYQYDGLNRLVQVNHGGTIVFDADARPIAGQLGSFVLRYVYDGLGRIIRKDQPDEASAGATFVPIRLNDYYYDGIRRIQDVIRRPLNAEPPDPCDEFHAVTRSPGTYGEWIRSDGQSIGIEFEACQPTIGPASSGSGGSGGVVPPTPSDPGGWDPSAFAIWTDRDYVYDPSGDLGGVDQFILQVSRDGTPLYMHQSVSLDVVALSASSGSDAIPVRQNIFSPYGEVVASDVFRSDYNNPVGFKGLFFDRFTPNPYPSVAGTKQGVMLMQRVVGLRRLA